MSSFALYTRGLAAAAILLLQACASGDTEAGIEASVAAVHHRHDAGSASPHGKHSGTAFKTFRRADGLRIDLERGRLNLSAVALEPCADAASLALRLADALLPGAHAHGGGGPGGAAVGTIDVLAPDLDTVVALGTLPALPGRYCGLTVELLATDAGSIDVAPCHYPNTVGVTELPAERNDDNAWLFEHDCLAVRYDGPALRRTIDLDPPLTLDAARRTATLTVGTAYDRWFESVHMDRLETDAGERRRLALQVLSTVHLHAH